MEPVSSLFFVSKAQAWSQLTLLLAKLSPVLCVRLTGASLCGTRLAVAIAVEMSTAMELLARCDTFVSLLLSPRLSQ